MYQRILVPIDGSPTAIRALDGVVRLSKLTNGHIWLLHVLDQRVFSAGFEAGATYLKDVLPRMRMDDDRILANGCPSCA